MELITFYLLKSYVENETVSNEKVPKEVWVYAFKILSMK